MIASIITCRDFTKGKRLGLVRKLIVGAGAVASLFSGNVKADNFNAKCKYINPSTGTQVIKAVQFSQISGATEGDDPSYDVSFLAGPTPTVDFFIRNYIGDYGKDARGPNSTSDFYARVEGRGLSESITANLYFSKYIDENNFSWKNLIVELYNEGDVNNPANRLAIADGMDLVNKTASLPALTIHNGLSYQMIVKPRNYADLDFNQKVDFKDFATCA